MSSRVRMIGIVRMCVSSSHLHIHPRVWRSELRLCLHSARIPPSETFLFHFPPPCLVIEPLDFRLACVLGAPRLLVHRLEGSLPAAALVQLTARHLLTNEEEEVLRMEQPEWFGPVQLEPMQMEGQSFPDIL